MAVIFGSIGTIVDTSELQREAFNRAFAENGLDWHWDRESYRESLRQSGGRDRIEAEAARRGETVDAAAVHAAKSSIFRRMMEASQLVPRPGVAETIRAAREAGRAVAFATTTSRENVEGVLAAVADALGPNTFDLVADRGMVDASKPDPAIFRLVVERLGEGVVVEDNSDGVRAAVAAGLPCLAFPNENTAGHDFSGAVRIIEGALDPDEVLGMDPSA